MAEINVDRLVSEMSDILAGYAESVTESVQKEAEKVAKQAAKELRQTSPARSGNYAKSWTARKADKTRYGSVNTVHNKKHYRLTHLLEHGHVGKSGRRVYGTVKAIPHIVKVEQKAIKQFEDSIRKDIQS